MREGRRKGGMEEEGKEDGSERGKEEGERRKQNKEKLERFAVRRQEICSEKAKVV